MRRFLIKSFLKYIKSLKLTETEENILNRGILDTLGGLPIYDIITINEAGQLLIDNRPVDMEKAAQLRYSAKAALENHALKTVYAQVTYQAFLLGAHKVESERQLNFARAAIWWGQQEERLLKLLAQDGEPLA
jgi:hypothetical protein